MAEAERYQHYKVLRREDGSLWELGRGAMGVTYKAFDTNLRCPVALKVINNSYLNSEIARQRFLREARAAASLRHQNVASVFHLGTDHESYFYAMEFVDGETVDVYIKRKGLLDPAEALGIVIQVSRALSAADKEKLVHRDLKPSNLMLVHEEEEMVVKVIDFGLAKSTEKGAESSGTLTVGGGFVGTPHFASPEQLEERELDIRSDIYSLGATLYYMLTGRPPYAGSLAQVMSQHLYKPVPLEPLEGFPPCVVELIRRMMEKDPAKRPQRPADLRREILPCLNRLEASASGARSIAEKPNAGEQQLDPLATLDLSTQRPGVEESASLIAQRYKIISELGDLPQGRRFLADDRRRNRQVSLTVLSRDFVSDSKRYMALEHEIDRLRRSTTPLLRQVYSLESTAQQSFLVEEYIVGPTLLEVLRARGFLSPAETWLLLNLLAPVADDAQSNELQQVDFTLSGIQLTSPRLTETWTASDVLRRPLTRWEQLGVKVPAVDFSLSVSDKATWGGTATLIQAVPGVGPKASYLRLLSLLVYELLGGPRSTVELTGRYSPVAGLSEQGNALLRRGLMDDFQSATELARQLGGEIVARNVDPVTTTPAPASSPELSLGKIPSGTSASPSPPTQPGHFAGQQPAPAPATVVKGRRAPAKSIAILVLVAILGAAGYFLRQFFLAPPNVTIEQSTASTSSVQTRIPPKPQTGVTEAGSAGSVGAAVGATPGREALASPTPVAVTTPKVGTLATPSPVAVATLNGETAVSPSPVSVATPDREALTTPSPVAVATPNPEALGTPSPVVVATPDREALATPSPVAAATRNGETAVSPSPVSVATPDREALTTRSPVAVATPNPEALGTPSPVAVATPDREALATPSPVAAATPNREVLATPGPVAVATPDREALATPSPVAAATPNREVLATPSPVAVATPDRKALATPNPIAAATPNREVLATPSPVAVATPDREPLTTPSTVAAATPNREALATPSPVAVATPDREALATPSPVAAATPNRESLATPSPVAAATPDREALATPSPVAAATPNRESLATPSPMAVATPDREALATSSPVAAATPNREALATPSPITVAKPDRETLATPSPVAAATPNRESLATPSPVAVATPDREPLTTPSTAAVATPNREVLATPSPVAVAKPDRKALATPSPVAAATPNRQVLATPSPVAVATPDREPLTTPSTAAVATPNGEALATPRPIAVATANRETLATPNPVTDREAEPSPSAGASPEILAMVKHDRTAVPGTELPGPESHAVQTSSSAENYSDRLASAQRLIESTDWPGALKVYVDLIDQYPERPAARQSLESLLTDLSANATLVDPESSALMKPDLIRAAEAGIVPAMLMLARTNRESDRAAALKWYEAAAAKGSVEGMKKAGSLLYSNHLRPEDDLKALDYFTQAGNTGDPEGAYLAGECYYFGKGTAPDMDKAVQFLQLAASRRDVRAMDLLGTCYRKQGKFELARRSFEGAATAGYALSYFNLGVMYMNGEGVPRSSRKGEEQFRHSAELFRQGAEKGDPVAMFYFASWNEQGIGVPKDGKTATEWYRRSARAGYPQAIEWCRRNGVAP